MVKKMKSPRRLAALAIFAVIAMSAFGFAAANTVGNSNAGDGQAAVSGGNVTNISYTVSGGAITGATFDYDANVSNVRAALKDSAVGGVDLAVANTAACTITHPTPTSSHFVCSFGAGAAIAAVNGFQVSTWN